MSDTETRPALSIDDVAAASARVIRDDPKLMERQHLAALFRYSMGLLRELNIEVAK